MWNFILKLFLNFSMRVFNFESTFALSRTRVKSDVKRATKKLLLDTMSTKKSSGTSRIYNKAYMKNCNWCATNDKYLRSFALNWARRYLPGNASHLSTSYKDEYGWLMLHRRYKTFLVIASIVQTHHSFEPPENK